MLVAVNPSGFALDLFSLGSPMASTSLLRIIGTNAMLLAPSEARKAARAALGAQERSELDEAVYDECNGQWKGNPGKVKGMLDRGADPNGYKVRRT